MSSGTQKMFKFLFKVNPNICNPIFLKKKQKTKFTNTEQTVLNQENKSAAFALKFGSKGEVWW